MDRTRIQVRIGILILLLLTAAILVFSFQSLVIWSRTPLELVTSFTFVFDVVVFGIFLFLTLWRSRYAQWAMAMILFCSSGIVIVSNPSTSYFGLGTIVLGALLFQRFGMLEKHFGWKVLGLVAWTLGFVLFSDTVIHRVEYTASLATFAFVAINIYTLYILFEEEIRELLAANKQKDAALAEQAAEIARLVPLSVLGERVAHVTHSFKNNLNLLGTAQFYLEQGGDPQKASLKLQEFTRLMNERIDNILMVSRAGADQKPELFDAARVLSGLNQVYMTEPAFLHRAKVELNASQPTPVEAVRWDFILLAENILKNALEALTAKGGYGNIRVTLQDRLLTLANDGGAMALCSDCRDSCLDCPRYGKPGRTTKADGSGHGLAQVFATCRKYGWTLRIRTQEEWTLFEIGLPPPPKGGIALPEPLLAARV